MRSLTTVLLAIVVVVHLDGTSEQRHPEIAGLSPNDPKLRSRFNCTAVYKGAQDDERVTRMKLKELAARDGSCKPRWNPVSGEGDTKEDHPGPADGPKDPGRNTGTGGPEDPKPNIVDEEEQEERPMDRLSQDPVLERLYSSTVSLLKLGMQRWLNGDMNMVTMGRYLGYGRSTVNAIDAAMTLLQELHRNKRIVVNNLIDAYYYACDLDAVRANRPGDGYYADRITRKFAVMTKWFGTTVDDGEEAQLVRDVAVAMARCETKAKPEFSVTIPLMKNAMVGGGKGGDSLLGLLSWRIGVQPENDDDDDDDDDYLEPEPEILGQLVKKYAGTTKGDQVNRNHSRIIYHLVPLAFRYVYDFLHLFFHLSQYRLRDMDIETFVPFASYPAKFKTMLVDRYFEFHGDKHRPGGVPDIGELNVLIGFFRAREDCGGTPCLSNLNAYDDGGGDKTRYRQYLMNTMNKTLTGLVNAFGYGQAIWERIAYRITFTTVPAKSRLMQMMENSMNEGLEIMEELSGYFISGDALKDLQTVACKPISE